MKECYKPKTSNEIQKASEEYILKTHIDDANVQDHFIAGAEWMKEESFDGKALLYAVEKTAERTKKEVIEKAVEWMKEEMCYRGQSSGRGSWGEIKALGTYDSLEEFINEFKQTIQDEREDI